MFSSRIAGAGLVALALTTGMTHASAERLRQSSFGASRVCATPELLAGGEELYPGSWLRPTAPTGRVQLSPDGRFAVHFARGLAANVGRPGLAVRDPGAGTRLTGDPAPGIRPPARAGRLRRPGPPEVVEQVVQTLVAARQVLVEHEGWHDPSPDRPLDVYLSVGRPGSHSRVVPIEDPLASSREGSPVFIVLAGPPHTWPVQAVHQYIHAVQVGYSMRESAWLYEAAALLAEHRLTGGLALTPPLLQRRMERPHRALTAHGRALRGSAALFLTFLSETHGVTFMRTAWEQAGRRPGENSLAALDSALRLGGQTTLRESWRGFTILNGLPAAADRPARLYESLNIAVPVATPARVVTGLPDGDSGIEPLRIESLGAAYVHIGDMGEMAALRVHLETGRDASVSADALVSWRHAAGGWLAVPLRFEDGVAELGIPLEAGARVVLVVRNDRRRAVESAEVSFRIDPDPSFPYDLAHLSAESSLDQIDVSWGCESERRVYGWMVYRAEDPQGPFTALTSMPLPSIGDSDTPLAYHYSDNSVQPGVLYYYQVEGITVDGLARRSAVIARRAAPAPTAR